MKHSLAANLTIANAAVIDAVENGCPYGRPSRRLSAVWVQPDGGEFVLGTVAGFSGGASFSGTHGSVTFAWPDEKNPRTTGKWWQILVPDDAARLKIGLIVKTRYGEEEIPLLTGVPTLDGVREIYGKKKEMIEVKIDDVTGAAARIKDYTVPNIYGDKVDPMRLATTALGLIPYVCLYELKDVDACVSAFPNALAAADDALITQQDSLNPLDGKKRMRYGDRDGRVVYRIIQDPDIGQPFTEFFPSSGYSFALNGKELINSLNVEPYYVDFSVPYLNPYVDLASRMKIVFDRAVLDETVEIHGMDWRVAPREDVFKLKGRRQYTL